MMETLLNYPGLSLPRNMCICSVLCQNIYIVNFHVITALYIAVKGPGSLAVDVCSIGVVYLIHHTSYRGLNVRFEARDYVIHQVFSIAFTGLSLGVADRKFCICVSYT